ncbi:hypothetical protein COU91_00360 [Candidatus Saccharibacteria bacterium CG10_big_fil_rev_8_21_14_0_10_47_8]|nr:MAG: hypothetical protein COU91_00360 [Candidatus Saccharibacteria bacterium CG10_big_fil_rev_8_21_14_0_10_47_8]
MFLTITVVGVAVVSLLLALTVLLRNPHSSYNASFAAFAVLLGLWIPANFFGSYKHANIHLPFLFFTDFTIAPLLAFSLSYFGLEAVRFYRRKTVKINSFLLAVVVVLMFVFSLGAALHLVSLPIYTASNVLNTRGVLYYPYNMYIGILVFVGLLTLIYSTIGVKKEYKQQTRLVFWSLFLVATMTIAANIVFPEIKLAQTLSYFAVLVMLFSLSYSIVRHRLFDLRLIVARSVAYILVLTTLSTIFVALILAITTLFFRDERIGVGIKGVFIGLALLLAFIYQPLKRFFDKVTNKLFYRDAYDSQDFLNELNKSLVTTIDLEELLDKSAEIIGNTLKVAYCTFAIRGAQDPALRLVGGTQKQLNHDAIGHAVSAASHHADKIVVLDELESSKHHLKELMQAANISLLVKLQGTNRGHTQHPGYILLGQKRSGSLYSKQDITILEIIADELVIAIQNALRFEEIQQFNITLEEKIEAATKELRRTNAKLKALDEAKDEFISMASHQLRTPLTAVKGYLSMVLDGDVGPVKKNEKEMIQHAFDGAQRMVYLIADLLNVSRMQTGKFVIENQPSYLPEVVEAEIAQLKEQIANREITLTYDKPERFPTLNLDETKIRQVMMNFLDNALYYTPKGGKVDVALQATDDSVTYTVTDNGMGVPKTVQHHLFSKFYRADNARKMRPDGTGLGLYMAKKVIVAQGGAIIFKSEEGQGSTFGFSFPRKSLELKGEKAIAKTVANLTK